MSAVLWQNLKEAILEGDSKSAINVAKQLMDQNIEINELVEKGMTKTLESIGHKCMTEEFNLLEILLAGRTMMDVMNQVITPCLKTNTQDLNAPKETIILGTIQGDIHDLGKNITRTVLQCAGYRVVDLGKDVPPSEFISAAKKENAACIGVSCLLSSTLPLVKQIKCEAETAGVSDIKVILGGGISLQCEPQDLGVDFVATDVFHGLQILNNLLKR